MTASIRLAREADAAAMQEIYAPIVRDTAISFELVPPTEAEFKQRISNTVAGYPWLACESAEGDVLGYAYASSFRAREAYQWTTEVTVYVHPNSRGRGVGRAVYTSLFEYLRLQGYRSAVGVISLPNAASVALHEAVGFTQAGVFETAGFQARALARRGLVAADARGA